MVGILLFFLFHEDSLDNDQRLFIACRLLLQPGNQALTHAPDGSDPDSDAESVSRGEDSAGP